MKPRVAIVDTHPIQYHAPWYRALSARSDVATQVLYCYEANSRDQARAGFNVEFDWGIPLLDGYPYEFLPNVAAQPGLTFRGLNTPELSKRIRASQYDAVVVSGWHFWSAWQAIRACWQSGTPVLVRSDSHLKTPRHPLKSTVKWSFYRSFIPRLDACLPVGNWSREYFVHYGAKPGRIFEVPHVVDSARISTEAANCGERRNELRQQWDLPPDDAVFLFAGKFVEKKRPLDFVQAIAQARSQGVRIAGLMVGDGPLRSACEAEAARSAAPVRFAGFLNQKEIVGAYVAADALVLPSDGGETWGLVVNEAMVCGRPAFVSDQVGCGPDLIEGGITGATFPCGDPGRLAVLLREYSEPALLRTMGHSARQKISVYSPAAAAAKLVEALQSALDRIPSCSVVQ